MQGSSWAGRSVFITGHTGFKGGWLSLWLNGLGAKLHGYALHPPTTPNFFEVAALEKTFEHDTRADLADLTRLRAAMSDANPEIIFHLAAQPLVREGYFDPIGTLKTNVIGTANVLESARDVESVRAIVVITTDKVYENLERDHGYHETEALGGHDPYSASKAAAEIVTSSYRRSFFGKSGSARVATARAGNVIGGGDWASDRLVPDCIRAFAAGDVVRLRYPDAIRPWQHVLEPISGYVLLGEHLIENAGEKFAKAWNFGPDQSGDATVSKVANETARLWGQSASVISESSSGNPHEAGLLRLNSDLARTELGWAPRWSLEKSLQCTVDWYRSWLAKSDMSAVTASQLHAYQAAASR